jgi:hypothetical protein
MKGFLSSLVILYTTKLELQLYKKIILYPIIGLLIYKVCRAAKSIGKSWCSLPSDAKATSRVPSKAVYTFARIKLSLRDNFIKILYFDRGN